MSSEFTFISSVVGEEWEPIVSAGLVAALVFAVGSIAVGKLKTSKTPLVPDSRLTTRSFFELVAEFLLWLGDTAMGKENRKYIPLAGTIFLYILFSNLLGLVPGFVMPTHSFLFNMGIAATVFVLYNAWGIKEVGPKAYFMHLCGPVFQIGKFRFPLLCFLLFPIEVISHFIRPLSLSLRLFGNMTGDHTVVGVFTELTQGTVMFFIPVVFYILGTVVSLIQAFVFTLLTMIYIRLAVAHEDHGDEHGSESHGAGQEVGAHGHH